MSPLHSPHLEALTVENAADAAVLHAKCFARGWPVADFRRYAEDMGCYGLMARLDKRAAAGFVIARTGGDEGEILTIATDPALRRKGIARALLSSTLEKLTGAEVTTFFLEVGVTNEAAITLYKSLGFEPVGKRVDYYHHANTSEDALIMRRMLRKYPQAHRRS
ncbi:MAG TPA: ribosomal protein S18-alanine N-acetyltransferase [Hyphomicrobiales bacterium]|nr:ribosomal protein S18-alanine N-acetyltransferase [Hyphomicrobiales bacterium]